MDGTCVSTQDSIFSVVYTQSCGDWSVWRCPSLSGAVSLGSQGSAAASRARYPYAVSIQFGHPRGHSCSGVLVSKQWVLTSATCAQRLQTNRNPAVYVGAFNLASVDMDDGVQVRNFTKVFLHPRWDDNNKNVDNVAYNIAMILLDEAIVNVTVPLLANGTLSFNDGQRFPTIGWGPIDDSIFSDLPEELQETELAWLRNDQCQRGFHVLEDQGCPITGSGRIVSKMLCAWGGDGVDPCSGLCETGAPLLYVDTSVRILSEGDPTTDTVVGIFTSQMVICRPDVPLVYVSVGEFFGWIGEVQILTEEDDVDVAKIAVVSAGSVVGIIAVIAALLWWRSRRRGDHLPVSVLEVGEGKEGWPGMVTGKPANSSNVSGTVGDTMVSEKSPFEVGRQDVQWKWHKEQYSFFVLSRWMEGTVDVYENQVLGRGASSIAKKGMWDGTEVAVRFSEASSLEKEAQVLEEVRKLEHDNIIKIFGVNPSARSTGRYGSFIVMEMMHCSLRQVLQDPFCVMSLTYLQLVEVLLEVARGLVALHTLRPPVTHGDVKPGNILLSARKLDGRLKLAAKISDFDCSRQRAGGHVSNRLMGTRGYIAPELYWTAQASNVDGEKLDVYALGIVMLDCVGVGGGRAADDPSGMAQCCPKEILDLVHECVHEDARSRCALGDAMNRLQALLDDVRPWSEGRVKRKLSDLLEHATQGGPSMANDGNATAFSDCGMAYRDLLGMFIAIVQELKVVAVSEAASLEASQIVLQKREGSCYRAMVMAGCLSDSDAANNANGNSAQAPGDSIRVLGGFIWTLLSKGHQSGMCALEKTMGAHPDELVDFVSKLRGWEVAVSTEQLHGDCDSVSKELISLQSREWARSGVSCEDY
ncbi:unnamed protein product [Ostreobium quekettii]|uniref:Protein kinase domain-containing protein n=1 Tax=Ostreobium quekettii TaxID=121088 RepID=A0A8S1J6G8_9CHLO|nr:unnamed protein product [Ostreobium quekettii]|eukprot:evm.model.scf_1011EXC.3 EVM.evm.TU.scf_1011EXC.3   scf_1011EXC:24412-27862(+)